MELPTVRFTTDTTDAGLLEPAVREAAEDPSIRQAEVVDGFGPGLDIRVVLANDDGEDAARDAVLRTLPEGVRLETLPVHEPGDTFEGG